MLLWFQLPTRQLDQSDGRCCVADPSVLRSAQVSKGVFTTMTSADFSAAYTPEISSGKVHELSTRAARLYLVRLSVTFGFRVS